MKKTEQRVKQHIISMRVTTEELNSMREAMGYLKCRRVSDLMREAFKLMLSGANQAG